MDESATIANSRVSKARRWWRLGERVVIACIFPVKCKKSKDFAEIKSDGLFMVDQNKALPPMDAGENL